jgi:hypothetical protein
MKPQVKENGWTWLCQMDIESGPEHFLSLSQELQKEALETFVRKGMEGILKLEAGFEKKK